MAPSLAQVLARSPDVFPQALDAVSDQIRFLWLTCQGFEAAAFLDERILAPNIRAETIRFPIVEAAVAETDLHEGCAYIFHLGHVGSTLISRLLGAHRGVLSLREPSAFRNLAQLHAELETPESLLSLEDFDRRLSVILRLWSRTYAPDQIAVVKATSAVCEMAASLLTRPSRPPALFITAAPEVYLATLLGGQNAYIDVRAFAPMRLRRLHRRLGRPLWRLPDLSLGETMAMSWACEMTALQVAEDTAPGRGQWLDFDRFLSWPEPALLAAFAHLGRTVDEAEARAILAGPEMGRYSKAIEHAFDAGARRANLQQSRQLNGEEIGKGLAWLDRAAAEAPEIARALAQSEQAGKGR